MFLQVINVKPSNLGGRVSSNTVKATDDRELQIEKQGKLVSRDTLRIKNREYICLLEKTWLYPYVKTSLRATSSFKTVLFTYEVILLKDKN